MGQGGTGIFTHLLSDANDFPSLSAIPPFKNLSLLSPVLEGKLLEMGRPIECTALPGLETQHVGQSLVVRRLPI